MSLFFASLAVVAVVCLIIGWENPKRFKFAFGDKATTPFVRGSFGAAILVFGFLGQSLDPGRSADQIAANERRVAKSEARLRDARQHESESRERERVAIAREREAQKAADKAQQKADKEQQKAEAIKAQNARAEKSRSQSENDESDGTKGKPSVNWGKKLDGLLDRVVKTQQVQSYAETDEVTLTLRNRDDFAWTDVKVNINPTFGYLGGYEYTVKQMRSGGEIIVPLREFATPQGERLKPFETKLLTFALRCKTPDGTTGVFRGNWPSATG